MDIDPILTGFLKAEASNILILDEAGELLYQSEKFAFPVDIVLKKIKKAGDFDEQEFFDKANRLYFNVKSSVITEDGRKYRCYRLFDESEYALLVKEVASYSRSIADMSGFQTGIMNKLSMPYDAFLLGLNEYCGAEESIMYMETENGVTKSRYESNLVRTGNVSPQEYSRYFDMKRGTYADGLFCVLNSVIQGHRCVVLVRRTAPTGIYEPLIAAVHNVLSLFIENSILRDRIVYDSEHDKLTGLYNKGKYMMLKTISFGSPASIAVYNFDVNNLKHINDTYGHEYGDALIIKAARSISAVVSENVMGFRMGGDEYVMIAANVSVGEAEQIRMKWQAALNRLNEEDKTLFCSMACGLAYGSGEYDYDELYADADKLMYENKKQLKANNITSSVSERELRDCADSIRQKKE